MVAVTKVLGLDAHLYFWTQLAHSKAHMSGMVRAGLKNAGELAAEALLEGGGGSGESAGVRARAESIRGRRSRDKSNAEYRHEGGGADGSGGIHGHGGGAGVVTHIGDLPLALFADAHGSLAGPLTAGVVDTPGQRGSWNRLEGCTSAEGRASSAAAGTSSHRGSGGGGSGSGGGMRDPRSSSSSSGEVSPMRGGVTSSSMTEVELHSQHRRERAEARETSPGPLFGGGGFRGPASPSRGAAIMMDGGGGGMRDPHSALPPSGQRLERFTLQSPRMPRAGAEALALSVRNPPSAPLSALTSSSSAKYGSGRRRGGSAAPTPSGEDRGSDRALLSVPSTATAAGGSRGIGGGIGSGIGSGSRSRSGSRSGGGGGGSCGDRTYSDVDEIIEREGAELVILALETLGKLTQPNTALLPVVQQVVLPYLEAHDSRVRTAAVSTCANLILPPHEQLSLRGPSARATETIVSRLLEVAVSDTSRRVRLTVMHCLDTRFDRFLSQTHHIDRVMFLFSDDLFDIRSEALAILGRLAKYVSDPHYPSPCPYFLLVSYCPTAVLLYVSPSLSLSSSLPRPSLPC